MTVIRRLSKQLASQIAAGEVVERPASVVKELLENAVDAHANKVLCEIKSAGKVLIRVRDDGVGIEKDDLALALAPHATSKVYTVEDLAAIHTLGFRGEALASIASVSKLTLTSKTKDQEHAFSVSVEGPEQEPNIMPAAHPTGSTVDVAELFFNTPARRRFLKSDRTEFLKIKDTFIRVALAHTDVGFELISDGKTILKVNKSTKEQGLDHQRTSTLIGSDFSCDGIKVLCEDPNLKMEGMLLPPPPVEASVSDQIYLFLNGRPIADKVVTHALKEAFYEVLGQTLPIRCVLYLSIDPKAVDVNVHPRKDEVRFHETALVHDLIVDSIVLALKKAGVGPISSSEDLLLGAGITESAKQSAPTSAATTNAQNSSLAPSMHSTSFDINSNKLPAFPNGMSSFINLNDVKDRSSPVITHANTSLNSNKGGTSATSPSLSPYAGTLSNQDQVNRNINLFKSQVSSQAVGTSANLNLKQEVDLFTSTDKIAFLDMVDSNIALVKEEGNYYFVNIKKVYCYLNSKVYAEEVENSSVQTYALTIPFSLKLEDTLIKGLKNATKALLRCGFELNFTKTKADIIKIPQSVKGSNLTLLCQKALPIISAAFASIEDGHCPLQLSLVIAQYQNHQNNALMPREVLKNINAIEDLAKVEGASVQVNLKQLAYKFGGASEE